MTAPRPAPTIALVAVPGSGDERSGAAARSLADLLLRLRGRHGSRYSSFVEHSLRIPTKPALVNPRSAPNVAPDLGRSIFAEQHPFLRTQLQYGGAAARDREEDSPDHQLMRAQLADYQSTGEPYDTVRLEGERLGEAQDGGAPEVQTRLHVFEMRWAELSRPTAPLRRFGAELLQLFLHLAHLGRTALDHARLEHPTSALWRAYGTAHTWAVRLLTVVVPALFVAMLTTVAGAAALELPGGVKPYLAGAATVLLAGALVASSAYQTRVVRALAASVPITFVLAIAAFGLTARVRDPIFDGVRRVAGNELLVDRLVLGAWILAAGGLAYLVFRAYERLRPGALPVGLGAYILAATPLTFVAAGSRSHDELLDGTLHVFEATAAAAVVAWNAIYLLGALSGCLGLVACFRLDGPARDRGWRATRTAAATLAVTATLALVGTLFVWAAVFRAASELLSRHPFSAMIPAFASPSRTYAEFFERVLEVSAGAGLPVLILFAGAIVLTGALALAPAVAKEIRPPRASDAFDERATAPPEALRGAPVDTDELWAMWERFRREGDASHRLGERLGAAFTAIGSLTALLYGVVFVLAPAVSVVFWISSAPALAPLQWSADAVVLVAGGCLLAAAVALVALRRRFRRLTLGFRTVLDVVLDVDRYLRTHPRDATPRARVAERYVSLLRYLCHWRDHSGRPYDAIVIVAHSQAAAITADLLNFVQREEDPELEPIRRPLANGLPGAAGRRLFVLTMGNPLRQLYAAWFPHLFGWVRGETGDGVSRRLPAVPREPWMLLPRLEDGHRVFAPAIPDAAAPDPYAMGITRWVNVYRSGDYVGRALWRQSLDSADWMYRPAPSDAATRFVGDVAPVMYASEDTHRSRRELCIGAGAHAHYWDATAKAVAVELDLLVADAARLATRVAKDTGAPAEGMES